MGEGWVLAYAIKGISALDWDASWVTDDGAEWTVTVPATATRDLGEGVYEWAAAVTLSGARYTVLAGSFHVEPNLELAQAGDRRSHAEKTLAVINAALEGRLTADIQFYQIAGRTVSKIQIAELLKLRSHYTAMVYREQHPGRLGVPVEIHL